VKGEVMNLQQINQTNYSNYNDSVSNIYDTSSKSNHKNNLTTKTITVDQNINFSSKDNISAMASDLKPSMDRISSLQTIDQSLTTQQVSLDSIAQAIEDFQNNQISSTQAQDIIKSSIQQYNLNNESVEVNTQKLQHRPDISTTYFDGKIGAVPKDIDILSNEMQQKSATVTKNRQKVDGAIKEASKEAYDMIQSEHIKNKNYMQNNINFANESKNFTQENIKSSNSSFSYTQTNTSVSSVARLLS
jgi:pterin-4a-carbinolamine dehydratase